MAESEAKPETGSSTPVVAGGEGSALTTTTVTTAPAPAATPVAATPPATPPAWKAQLTPELKADPRLDRFKTISELGQEVLDFEERVASAVTVPGENSTQEERATFFKKLGVPESPKDYKLEKLQLPDGFTYQQKSEDEFRAVAHKLNLTDKQTHDLHGWYLATMVKALSSNLSGLRIPLSECQKTLRGEWKDRYDAELRTSQRGFEWFMGEDPEVKALFERTGLGNNPKVIARFNLVGRKIGESTAVQGTTTNNKPADFGGRNRDASLAEVLYGKKGA